MNTQTKTTISPSWMGMVAGLLAIVAAMSFANVAVARDIVVEGLFATNPNNPFWRSEGKESSNGAAIPIEVVLGDVLIFQNNSTPDVVPHGVTFNFDNGQDVQKCNESANNAPLLEIEITGDPVFRPGQNPPPPANNVDQCENGGSNLDFTHIRSGALPREMVRLEVVKTFDTIDFRCSQHNGVGEMTVRLSMAPPPDPSVQDFSANPSTITVVGGSSTLTYATTNATSVDIDNGGGTGLPPNGSVTVTPAGDTTYTLTATGAPDTTPATDTETVTVAIIDGDCLPYETCLPECEELSPWKRISEMTPEERECWGYAG